MTRSAPATSTRCRPFNAADAETIDRMARRNWTMVVGVTVLTTVGLFAAVVTGVREKMAEVWPWAGTDMALVVGFSLIVLLFTLYLTRQQQQVIALRRELRRAHQHSTMIMRLHCERLFALLTVSRSLATATDPETVFDCITETCRDTFDGEQASLMLLDRESNELEVRAATGHLDPEKVLGIRVQLGQGVAGWVAQNRKPVLLGRNLDSSRYPGFTPKKHEVTVAMVVPIAVRNELIGVLNVASRRDDIEYTEEDLRAIEVFAENAGIACRHAEQASWMRQTIQRLDEELQKKDASSRAA